MVSTGSPPESIVFVTAILVIEVPITAIAGAIVPLFSVPDSMPPAPNVTPPEKVSPACLRGVAQRPGHVAAAQRNRAGSRS